MAFTVTELFGTSSLGVNERTYTRRWRVVSDSVIQHPVLTLGSVPVIVGAIFPYDSLAQCQRISADYEDATVSREVVIVDATYDTGSGGDDKIEDENPLNDRPDIRWGSRTVRLPVRYTSDDPPQGIVNSAGQKFDPPPEEDFQILVYEFAHNVATYDENQASDYRGAINSDAFTLAGLSLQPYQARIQSIEATNEERNGVRFWRESIVVEIVDDWRLTLIDEGTRKKTDNPDGAGDPVYLGDGQFGGVEPVLDAFGNPIFEEVLLDGNGGVLADGADPVLLTFNTAAKPLQTFATLGLPIDNNP